MTIQPLDNRPREISVTEPLGAAYARTKQILFEPFDLAKWLIIGFCAWLAKLGQGGGGGGYGFNNHNFTGTNPNPREQLRHAFSVAHDYYLLNLAWIVPAIAFAIVFLIALGMLFLWLSSRGKFMMLHCVAENRAEIEIPWKKYGPVANRLFLFRLVLGLAGLILILPIVVVEVILIIRLINTNQFDFGHILILVGFGCSLALIAVVLGVIQKLLEDFVVPILYLRGGSCRAAWREFFQLLRADVGLFILYILFQIALALGFGMLIITVILVTCCTAGCLMMVPYFGTVILLPILIFKRSYSLAFLAQFGPAYDVFPPAPPPPPPLTPPPGLPAL